MKQCPFCGGISQYEELYCRRCGIEFKDPIDAFTGRTGGLARRLRLENVEFNINARYLPLSKWCLVLPVLTIIAALASAVMGLIPALKEFGGLALVACTFLATISLIIAIIFSGKVRGLRYEEMLSNYIMHNGFYLMNMKNPGKLYQGYRMYKHLFEPCPGYQKVRGNIETMVVVGICSFAYIALYLFLTML